MRIRAVRDHVAELYPDRRIECFTGGNNLGGLRIAHDFNWSRPKHFTHGKKLAEYIRELARDKHPILYLTNQDRLPAVHENETFFVVRIHLDHYREHADPNPGKAYFSILAGLRAVDLAAIDTAELDPASFAQLVRSAANRPHLRRKLYEVLKELAADSSVHSEEPLGDDELNDLVALLTAVVVREGAAEQLAEVFSKGSIGQSLEDAVRVSRWRSTVEEFERQLHEDDQSKRWDERSWEEFFKSNPWLLGLNAQDCVFLSEVQWQASVGGQNLDGKGNQVIDQLAAAAGSASFTVLIELKTPAAPLMGKQYRKRTYVVGEDVSGGVAQLQSAAYTFDSLPRGSENKASLAQQGFQTVRPQGVLVVGHLGQIYHDQEKLRCFELFRGSLQDVRVITFDQVLERAKALITADDQVQQGPSLGPTEFRKN